MTYTAKEIRDTSIANLGNLISGLQPFIMSDFSYLGNYGSNVIVEDGDKPRTLGFVIYNKNTNNPEIVLTIPLYSERPTITFYYRAGFDKKIKKIINDYIENFGVEYGVKIQPSEFDEEIEAKALRRQFS